MTTEQRAELERLLKAVGPMMATLPRSVEFSSVRTLAKLVQFLAQITLQEADAQPAIPGRGIVRHIKGPKVPA